MLLALIDAEVCTASQVAAKSGDEVQEIVAAVNDDECLTGVGDHLTQIATHLMDEKYGEYVPTNKKDLILVGVDETVASMMMQHVFGSTDIVVGLHTRKLVVALDMFDWEESKVTQKKDVKMAKITAASVKRSLDTWLPLGDRRNFQDTMETLGAQLGDNEVGFWGKLTNTLNKHFSAKDKKSLLDMCNSVLQFYKVTRGGGRKRASCS